jgi:SAM-dependent methyltransferase
MPGAPPVSPDRPNTNMPSAALRNPIRLALMPGFDLLTRRRVFLARYWRPGPRRVLDAGVGNGWFAYLAYRSGAAVLAIGNEEGQVAKARAFYNGWMGIPEDRLRFQLTDLRALDTLEGRFDEILCYETLEHILDDRRVCTQFRRLLADEGDLHICVPNAAHPRWAQEPLDERGEWGGHVRAGYTHATLDALLQPLGFERTATAGVGGSALALADQWLQRMRGSVGDLGAAPVALPLLSLVALDSDQPKVPYSVYGRFRKAAFARASSLP